MHCHLKYVLLVLLLLALSKTPKCALVNGEIVEFSGPLTCMEDGENHPFPDQTCPVRDQPYSCSIGWKTRPACKCDDDCALFDECCPDVNEMELNASLIYPHPKALPDKMAWEDRFVPYMTCETTWYEQYYRDNITYSQYFFLIGRCPEYVSSGSKIRLYCEEPPTSDGIFVTPMTVERIGHFKNFYCAMCHGVGIEMIKPWVWKWRCKNVLDLDVASSDDYEPTYSEQFLISVKECSRSLEPPFNIPDNITPRRCFPDVDVTMCSPTYSADSNTQMRCPSYQAPVKFDGTVYKNLACAYCNGIDVCRDHIGLCNSMPVYGIVDNDEFPSLAEFFAFNPSSDQSAASSCAFNEAFDPITRACQVVYCLSGFAYNGTTGRCERLPVDEVGRVCLSFYSQSNGKTEVNITLSDVEYLTGAMNSLIISSPYDMLASKMVVELPQISCKLSENDSYDDERCYEQNETIACQTCFKVEMNFTSLIASNINHGVNTSFSFNDTSCYFTPSFGNMFVSQMVIDVPADWTCDSYSSFFSGHTNDTLLTPFKVEMLREAGEYEMNVLSGEYICRDNLTLTCKRYAIVDPENFESVVTDDSEDTIRLGSDGTVLTEEKFQVMSNGSVLYCLDEIEQSGRLPRGLDIMTLVGTILSVISVLVVIVTYTVFSKLRNMAGKSVLALSVALLITFLLMSLAAVSSSSKNFCKAMAAAIHFFWLSIFFWMNALAIDLNRTFGSRAKIRVGSKSQIFYVWYSLYAWGTPALIVGACLIIDLCDCTTLRFEYGSDGLCWLSRGDANLYGFGVPLAALLFLNIILFSDTVVGIRLTKKASEKAVKERPALARAKEELSLYIKLSCVMGFTWIFAFICEYTDVPELWYIFTAVNSLQGVFILFAFGLNRRVTALWREKLGIKRKEATSSSQGNTKSTNTQNSTVG